jgi:hypothetical protein
VAPVPADLGRRQGDGQLLVIVSIWTGRHFCVVGRLTLWRRELTKWRRLNE